MNKIFRGFFGLEGAAGEKRGGIGAAVSRFRWRNSRIYVEKCKKTVSVVKIIFVTVNFGMVIRDRHVTQNRCLIVGFCPESVKVFGDLHRPCRWDEYI